MKQFYLESLRSPAEKIFGSRRYRIYSIEIDKKKKKNVIPIPNTAKPIKPRTL